MKRKFGELSDNDRGAVTSALVDAVGIVLDAAGIETKGIIVLFGDNLENLTLATDLASEDGRNDRRSLVKYLRSVVHRLQVKDPDRN